MKVNKISLLNLTNRFPKGHVPWNKGTSGSYSEEYLMNMRDARKGFCHSEETKRKMSLARKGKPQPWKHGGWPKGQKRSNESRKRMSLAHKGLQVGEKHPNWKGGVSRNKEYLSWQKNKRNRNPREGSHTWNEWEAKKARYFWMCLCCKQHEPKIKLTQDHIVPLSKGGSDNIENIQPLCLRCNLIKSTKIIDYTNQYV